MATQQRPSSPHRIGVEAQDPAHRHHPGRADRRGAPGPQAREHHDRPVGQEHVRRPVRGAAAQLAALRDQRQPVRRPLLRRHGRPHRRRQRDHLALAAEADRQDPEAGPSLALPLDERSRGKITLGDMTILFQFVTPPSPQPRPQLPASVRGSMTSDLDWSFAIDRRRFVPAAPLVGHLPAQRRLAAQARHRGDPRPLRQDDEEARGAAEAEEKRSPRRTRRRSPKRRKGEEKRSARRRPKKKELTPRRKPSAWPRRRPRPTPSVARGSPSR